MFWRRDACQPPHGGAAAGDRFVVLGEAMARQRRVVVGAWLAAAALGLLLLPLLLSSLSSPPYQVSGSESERAGVELQRAFPALGAESTLLVLRSELLTVRDPSYEAAIRAASAAVQVQPGVTSVLPLPPAAGPESATPLPQVLGPMAALYSDQRTAYAVVNVAGTTRQRQDLAPAQRRAADDAARAASGGAVSAYLVGMPSLGHDLQRIELNDLVRVEVIAIPLALLVLLFGLRSPVAALLPVAVAGAGVLVALGLLAWLSPVFGSDGMLLIGVAAVGIAVGTDYALFVVSRYREELTGGATAEQAAGKALATSGRTVLYSGLVVIVAAAPMLAVRWAAYTQLIIGVVIVIVAEVAATLILLPAALVLLTRYLEWRPFAKRPTRASSAEGAWARWSRHLMRHPWPYLLGVISALIMVAVPATGLRIGIDLEREALRSTPSATGLEILEREPIRGLTGMVSLLIKRPAGETVPHIEPLMTALRADPLVAVVTTIDNGRDATVVVAVPRVGADSPQLVDLVHRIRGEILRRAGPAGHSVLVGGPGPSVVDIIDECVGKLWWVIGAVLALLFGLLVIVFRSLLLPLKAIAMNVLVIAAVLGLLVLVFQHGAGEGVLGFTSPGLIWAQVPLILFAVLFAVSLDYELFLVRRIQEEYLVCGDNTAAVAAGVQRTAQPIVLAAVIMATVFGSLLAANLVGIKEFGFAACAAIVLDATVVRLALVPALMQVFGRWNWWLPFTSDNSKGR